MSKGQTSLFCVLTLVLQLNFCTAALAAGCPLNAFPGRPICNQTCSKPPQILYGATFRCKVGFKVEWLDFRNKYNFVQSSTSKVSNSTQCKAPLMTGISLHPLPFENKRGFSPALRVDFDASFIGHKDKPELKAILLEFQSPVFETAIETRLTDQAYSVQKYPNGSIKYDNRKHRLFNFMTYSPDSYDSKHPITIGYPCLYGLDDCSNGEKVYKITLTSLLMTMTNSKDQHEYFKCNPQTCYMCSLNYTISVYPVRYNYWNQQSNLAYRDDYMKWNMTIATALYPSAKDIYVLLEPTKFDFYSIRLTRSGRIVRSKNTTDTSYTFKALLFGSYKIKVLLCRYSGCGIHEFETYHTITIGDAGVINGINGIQPTVTMIVACVSGTTLGVLLIAALAWLRCSRMKQKNGRGIEEPSYIILSNGDRASVGLSTKLGNALVALGVCKCNVLCPKNSSTVLMNIENHTNAYLLILLPVEHKTFQFQISKDNEYEQVIKSLQSYKIPNMFLIYFPFIEGAKRVPWEFLKRCKRIRLMNDYNKMIRLLKIKNDNNRTLEKVRSDLTTATEEAKQILMTYCDTSHKPIYQSNVNIDSVISCPIHKHQVNRECPVHPHHHDYPSHPVFVNYPDCGNDGIGNGLVNTDHHETMPLLENTYKRMIPPSPMPSLKLKKDSVESERVYPSESSGYKTSPEISSDNMNSHPSVEDDDSLIVAINEINKNQLPRTESMEDDEMFRINFL